MKKYFLPIMLCFCIVFCVGLVFGSDTPTQQVIVYPLTHVGQPSDNLVVLESYVVTDGVYDFTETPTDGRATTYRVPEGYKLIVTDVDWFCSHNDDAGNSVTIRLYISSLGNERWGREVFMSTINLDSNGRGGANLSLTTGFTVYPNMKIDLYKDHTNTGYYSVLLRGYLVPDSRTIVSSSIDTNNPIINDSSVLTPTPTATPIPTPTILPTPTIGGIKETTNSSGVWTGTWKVDGLGDFILTQNGDKVEGPYNNFDGFIDGIVSGNTLTGTWDGWLIDGSFEFSISVDGKSFTGKWKSEKDTSWKTVNGTKIK